MAAEPPAMTAPARTIGATHFIVEDRIIFELLGVVYRHLKPSRTNLNAN